MSEEITFREAEIRFFELIKQYPNFRKMPNKQKIELIELWPRIRYVIFNGGNCKDRKKKAFCKKMNRLRPHQKSKSLIIRYENLDGRQLRCLRCGHQWKPIKNVIKLCPKCKSILWNQAKR